MKMKCFWCDKSFLTFDDVADDSYYFCGEKCEEEWEEMIEESSSNYIEDWGEEESEKCIFCGSSFENFEENDDITFFCSRECGEKWEEENMF